MVLQTGDQWWEVVKMRKIFFIFIFILMGSTLVLAHGDEKDEGEFCPMHEQMEEIYGEEYMNNMHNSMHGGFKGDKQFDEMHRNNLWQKMMFWRWM